MGDHFDSVPGAECESAVVSDVLALKAAASSEGGVLAFRAFHAALNSALAVSRSLAEPIGSPPVRWTLTFQSQMGGVRSPARGRSSGASAIPRTCPGNDNAAPAEYVGRAALVYALGSQNPQRRLVAAAPIDLQGMTVFLRAFLVPSQKQQRRTSRISWPGGVAHTLTSWH